MYRIAELELTTESTPPLATQAALAKNLLASFEESFPGVREHSLWQTVTGSDVPLGVVCDLLASALPIVPELAQRFLSDFDVASRYRALMSVLKKLQQRTGDAYPASGMREFPPSFSMN